MEDVGIAEEIETNAVFAALALLVEDHADDPIIYKASKRAKPVTFRLSDPDAPLDIVAAYVNDIISTVL